MGQVGDALRNRNLKGPSTTTCNSLERTKNIYRGKVEGFAMEEKRHVEREKEELERKEMKERKVDVRKMGHI